MLHGRIECRRCDGHGAVVFASRTIQCNTCAGNGHEYPMGKELLDYEIHDAPHRVLSPVPLDITPEWWFSPNSPPAEVP